MLHKVRKILANIEADYFANVEHKFKSNGTL